VAEEECKGRVSLGTPAVYRIAVHGRLDESLSDRLGGLRISASPLDDETCITTLEGRLTDQAELVGVLNSLYQLHLPLLYLKLVR
jgi:hypothetical protein